MTKFDSAMARRALLCLALGSALAAASAQAQTPAAAPVRLPYGAPITLDDAKAVAAAAEAAAKAINVLNAVAVVEPTGDPVLMHKMAGTQYSGVDIAMDKARASARFRRPTKEFEDNVVGGRMAILSMPGAIPIAGGVLLVRGGKIIGAVGVSGGTSAQDNQVAEAAAAVIH